MKRSDQLIIASRAICVYGLVDSRAPLFIKHVGSTTYGAKRGLERMYEAFQKKYSNLMRSSGYLDTSKLSERERWFTLMAQVRAKNDHTAHIKAIPLYGCVSKEELALATPRITVTLLELGMANLHTEAQRKAMIHKVDQSSYRLNPEHFYTPLIQILNQVELFDPA